MMSLTPPELAYIQREFIYPVLSVNAVVASCMWFLTQLLLCCACVCAAVAFVCAAVAFVCINIQGFATACADELAASDTMQALLDNALCDTKRLDYITAGKAAVSAAEAAGVGSMLAIEPVGAVKLLAGAQA
jgi:hypothetical protein